MGISNDVERNCHGPFQNSLPKLAWKTDENYNNLVFRWAEVLAKGRCPVKGVLSDTQKTSGLNMNQASQEGLIRDR
jgi:hypothetical protein